VPSALKYVALYVPDLHDAERFYRDVFEMEVRFRESEGDDRRWYTVRPGVDWAELDEREVRIDMVALQRDQFVLALFRGDPQPGTVHEICVTAPAGELPDLRERLPAEATLLEADEHSLRFEDPFGFRWAVHSPGLQFRSSGEIAGRWIG
jgi:catechol 2,3-dioxygenase-like lactoylglutathione lyase family enzyme